MLTDNLAARIDDAAELKNMKGLGNAIDNDDSRSSNRLRIKDFQPFSLRGNNWFGRLHNDGFAPVGAR